jgi:hypothetical protein
MENEVAGISTLAHINAEEGFIGVGLSHFLGLEKKLLLTLQLA